MRFDGKVAIITGAGGGIGREHARCFAAHGAHVVVNDIGAVNAGPNEVASAERVVLDICDAGGSAVASTDTAATFDGARAIVRTALEAFGRVDFVVNNAAVIRADDLWRLSEDDWRLTLDVSLTGYYAMIRAAAPFLCAQGSGAIVNTSSASGFGHPSMVAYATAKEGVVGLTRSVARELGRFGVRCNAIRPAAASHHALTEYPEYTKRWGELIQRTTLPPGVDPALARLDPAMHAPRKVAPVVAWLCSDAARNVNGRTFDIGADVVALYTEPRFERMLRHEGGWTLDALDEACDELVGELVDTYRLDDAPHLQRFEP